MVRAAAPNTSNFGRKSVASAVKASYFASTAASGLEHAPAALWRVGAALGGDAHYLLC